MDIKHPFLVVFSSSDRITQNCLDKQDPIVSLYLRFLALFFDIDADSNANQYYQHSYLLVFVSHMKLC